MARICSALLVIVGIGIPLSIWLVGLAGLIDRTPYEPYDERQDMMRQVAAAARREQEEIARKGIELFERTDAQVGKLLQEQEGEQHARDSG